MTTVGGDRILFAEWGSAYQGASLLGAGFERSPCPICGHPTMDCTHDVPGGLISMATKSKSTDAPAEGTAPTEGTEQGTTTDEGTTIKAAGAGEPTKEAGREPVATAGTREGTVTVEATDKIEGVYEESSSSTFVTITKDVIETFYYPNTKTPSQRVLFAKGQVVPKSTIDALNANVEAARKRAESDEVALEDYVDSTTLASGTGATPQPGEGDKS